MKPQLRISIEKRYSVSPHPAIMKRLEEKICQLGEMREKYPAIMGHYHFREERDRITELQVNMVRYLIERQERYLDTKNPLDLEPVTIENVAENAGLKNSEALRLLEHLTIQLPRGRGTIFAEELIPGNDVLGRKMEYVLDQLREEKEWYQNGKWRPYATNDRLAATIRDRFALDVNARTVRKYMK